MSKTKHSTISKILTKILLFCFAVTIFANIGYFVFAAPGDPGEPEAPAEEAAAEAEPAAAADSQCANNAARCELPANATCPSGYQKSETDSNGEKTVCIRQNITDIVGNNIQTNDEIVKSALFLLEIQKFLNRLLWPVLVSIGGLLDNSMLLEGGMEERLRDIWVQIRDIVNILFVIVTLGVALYNILGIGEENSDFSIKSALPKIVVGIIAVNFSFLAIVVVLDVLNLFTTAVFSLPAEIDENLATVIDKDNNGEYDKQTKFVIKNLCENLNNKEETPVISELTDGLVNSANISTTTDETILYAKIGQKFQGTLGLEPHQLRETQTVKDKIKALETASPAEYTKIQAEISKLQGTAICAANNTLTLRGEAFLRTWNARNAAFAMAVNLGEIVFYKNISAESLTPEGLSKILVNTIFSLVLYFIYVASFLALFIILVARLIYLWICLALSPVLVLLLGASDLAGRLGKLGELSQNFFKNAIAPLIVGGVMTIGWIMLNSLKAVNDISQTSPFAMSAGGVPVAGLTTPQDFVVAIATIGVIWMGVFAAAEGTIADGAVNFIKESTASVGKYLATVPIRNLPIVPIKVPGADGNFTIGQVVTGLQEKFRSRPDYAFYDKIRGDDDSGDESDSSENKFKRQVRPNDVKNIQNYDDFTDFMGRYLHDNGRGNPKRLINGDLAKAFGTLRSNQQDAILRGASKNGLSKEVEKFLRSSDPEERKKAIEKILDHRSVRNAASKINKDKKGKSDASGKPETTRQPEAPTKPKGDGSKPTPAEAGSSPAPAATPAAAPATTGLRSFGTSDAIFTDGSGGAAKTAEDLIPGNPDQQKTALEQFTNARDKVVSELLKEGVTDDQRRTAVKSALSGVKLGANLPDKDRLPDIFNTGQSGKDNYDKIKDLLGDDDEVYRSMGGNPTPAASP